jgi:hypothetical protein
MQGRTQIYQRILLYTFLMVLSSVPSAATTAAATAVMACDHSIRK